jgi:hypothetical protein
MMLSRSVRRGFALLGVLWIIITLGVLAITFARLTYRAIAAAQGEQDRVTGRWSAEGCIARVRAVSDAVLSENPYRARDRWITLDSIVEVDSAPTLLGCDVSLRTDGRPVVARASAAELDSLPGMTPESVAKIIQLRVTSPPLTDLIRVANALSPDARLAFDASYQQLSRRLAAEPDAWVVRSRAHFGVPPTPVNIEARFVRAGTRAALVRWVEW